MDKTRHSNRHTTSPKCPEIRVPVYHSRRLLWFIRLFFFRRDSSRRTLRRGGTTGPGRGFVTATFGKLFRDRKLCSANRQAKLKNRAHAQLTGNLQLAAQSAQYILNNR